MASPDRIQHRNRALVGIGLGVLLGFATSIAIYRDFAPGKGTKWVAAFLAILPLFGWGTSHLARLRGYPTTVAWVLLFTAFGIAQWIPGSRVPSTFGAVNLFIGLLPVVVLMVLPDKNRDRRRHRSRRDD